MFAINFFGFCRSESDDAAEFLSESPRTQALCEYSTPASVAGPLDVLQQMLDYYTRTRDH